MPILSEAHFLELIDKYFPKQHPSLILGRGDDCAILRTQDSLCLSSDLFLEDIHFRASYFQAADVGHKALAVNISDIAAMGARPLGFNLNLGLSSRVDEAWLNDFFVGMSLLANEHNLALVGGDVARSDSIHICISIWGDCSGPALKVKRQNNQEYLTRGGAMPGDILFVVGQVGLARVGLNVLEAEGEKAKQHWPKACMAHLRPKPLVDAGLTIARLGMQARPAVLMDISDGLAKDLPRLLGMNDSLQGPLGAEITLQEVLLHPEVVEYNHKNKLCPINQAWLGGEDYALLGACNPKLFPVLQSALPAVYDIGIITDNGKLSFNGEIMTSSAGFDHFQ